MKAGLQETMLWYKIPIPKALLWLKRKIWCQMKDDRFDRFAVTLKLTVTRNYNICPCGQFDIRWSYRIAQLTK